MKTQIIILIIVISITLKAQTTVYNAKNDGSKNTSQFYYFDHVSGKVYECFSCAVPEEKKRKPDFTIKIEGNKIYSFIEKTEEKIQIGEMTPDKKIICFKHGTYCSKENAPYIKDKKIYGSGGNIEGIVEGKEIYGAAAYLMGQFR